MLKKISAILLLCCLFLNITGYQFLFHFHRSGIRAEMQKTLRHLPVGKQVEQFIFSVIDQESLSRLKWENSHEFSVDGKRYDLIDKKIKDGMLIVRCINDQKEEELCRNFNGFINDLDKNSSSNSRSMSFIKLVSNWYVPVIPVFNFNSFLFHTDFSHLLCQIFSAEPGDIITPPPQIS